MHNQVKISNKIKKFNEKISVSGDKSISIRCVLLATQAIGTSRIYNLLESEDVLNALKSIKKLGVDYKKKKDFYEIESFGLRSLNKSNRVVVNAGNSGTLARLILGILVDNDNEVTLKTIKFNKDKVILIPANQSYQTKEFKTGEIQVQGTLSGIIRKYI